MIYAIASNDQFRLNQECDKLLKELKIDEVFKFNATDTEEGDLLQELCTTSLFGQKCIVINHPIFLQNDYKFTYKNDFINFFSNPSDDIVLILLIDFIYDKNNELIKLLTKNTKIKVLVDLEEKDLNKLVINLLKEDGYSIDDIALEELIKRAVDTLTISNELEKLKLYCDNKVIKFEDVTLLVTSSLDTKIYDLTKYYFEKNKKMLMNTYYDIVSLSKTRTTDKKYDINQSIIREFSKKLTDTYYIHQLIKQRKTQEEIAEFFNIKKGAAYYKLQDAKKISEANVIKLINRLSKLDYELVTTTTDRSLAVELFLLEN